MGKKSGENGIGKIIRSTEVYCRRVGLVEKGLLESGGPSMFREFEDGKILQGTERGDGNVKIGWRESIVLKVGMENK